MDKKTELAYKRICFHGRGTVARWLDRAFFSSLGGVCLYVACRSRLLSVLLFIALSALLVLLHRKRWMKYRRKLWQAAADRLKREDWLRQEAERIRQAGGTILYPTPDGQALLGECLRIGKGAAFHCIGDVREDLIDQARSVGCTIEFHPWGEGTEPSFEQVLDRLRQDAPKTGAKLWPRLLRLPENRYLLTGSVLLLLSIFLKRAMYWRLLGSLCLMIGALRRSFLRTLRTAL